MEVREWSQARKTQTDTVVCEVTQKDSPRRITNSRPEFVVGGWADSGVMAQGRENSVG
jgi:hypothetical protein